MTLLFLLIVVVGMPLLAAISYRNIKTLEAEETDLKLAKTPVYVQSMIMQGGMTLLAYQVCMKEEYTISFKAGFNTYSIMAACIFLLTSLGFAYFSQKFTDKKNESTLKYLLPENNKERLMWVLAVVVAAFCEEYIYRGVLYQILLLHTDGKIWASVLLSAVVFGFGHGTQGEKAIIQIIPFAIGFHIIAILSN
ncbi:MAG: CPBP family intramembrane glutamic endopeptidase, partial [Bacteroidota bacterium]